MSTISKMETPTGQEETAILLEEQARRIATLQESLRQAGRIYPNEAVILQDIKRVVEERDDLRRRLENAEMLIERLKEDNEQFQFDLDLYNNADEKALALWRENHSDSSKCFVPGLGKMLMWLMDEVGRLKGELKQFESSERCANKLWREAHQGKDFWPGKTGLLMWLMEQIDNTTDKQPGGTTKLDKALQNIAVVKRILAEYSCPSEFGLEDCECDDSYCEDCWNEEVTE